LLSQLLLLLLLLLLCKGWNQRGVLLLLLLLLGKGKHALLCLHSRQQPLTQPPMPLKAATVTTPEVHTVFCQRMASAGHTLRQPRS
jgi:hypothetical protein